MVCEMCEKLALRGPGLQVYGPDTAPTGLQQHKPLVRQLAAVQASTVSAALAARAVAVC